MNRNHKISPSKNHPNKIGPRIIAISTALFFTSGCVVSSSDQPPSIGDEEDSPSQEATGAGEPSNTKEIVASSTATSTDLGSQLQVDIYALESVGNDLLRLRLGVTNNSNESFLLYSGLGDKENLHTASAITLLDSDNQKRYLSYNQSSGTCFCSSNDGNIGPGKTLDLWVIYPAPPTGVDSMTVVTPMTPPIFNVPIEQSSETVENTGLAEPEIIPLTMISDNLEDQTGRTESSEEVSIILSSDVLFKTNSSELSPEAQDILEQVATEINSASGSLVNIDGHADNTGSESINVPLSQDRAEAVESALENLVKREGIIFEVEGHGSADPIAENNTEEGRERNRRVSVTFEK